jgi:single-strand DNA-binding protein
VAGFTVASTPRGFDRDTEQWRDGEPLFLRCSIWRQPAEHVAESLRGGARVIVSGRLVQRGFHTRDGQPRTVLELEVEEVGVSLRYGTATITQTGPRTGNGCDIDPPDILEDVPAATGGAPV